MKVWDSTQKGIHMENYNTMPIEELVKNSRIRLEICDVEVDMYWKVAMEVLGVIADNNRAGKAPVPECRRTASGRAVPQSRHVRRPAHGPAP